MEQKKGYNIRPWGPGRPLLNIEEAAAYSRVYIERNYTHVVGLGLVQLSDISIVQALFKLGAMNLNSPLNGEFEKILYYMVQ